MKYCRDMKPYRMKQKCFENYSYHNQKILYKLVQTIKNKNHIRIKAQDYWNKLNTFKYFPTLRFKITWKSTKNEFILTISIENKYKILNQKDITSDFNNFFTKAFDTETSINILKIVILKFLICVFLIFNWSINYIRTLSR